MSSNKMSINTSKLLDIAREVVESFVPKTRMGSEAKKKKGGSPVQTRAQKAASSSSSSSSSSSVPATTPIRPPITTPLSPLIMTPPAGPTRTSITHKTKQVRPTSSGIITSPGRMQITKRTTAPQKNITATIFATIMANPRDEYKKMLNGFFNEMAVSQFNDVPPQMIEEYRTLSRNIHDKDSEDFKNALMKLFDKYRIEIGRIKHPAPTELEKAVTLEGIRRRVSKATQKATGKKTKVETVPVLPDRVVKTKTPKRTPKGTRSKRKSSKKASQKKFGGVELISTE
jgi:hypothetical protein